MKKIGVQLYTVRDAMKDEASILESFKKLVDMGYEEAQTAGCQVPYPIFGELAEKAGLTIVGTHDNWDMMLNDPQQSMENHRALKTSIIGVGGGPGLDSVEGIRAYIAQVNKVAALFGENGFSFSYHNHWKEFIKYDGKTVMDWLLEGMDPKNTSFCLDTFWCQYGGGDVRQWIEKLAGRIKILHLKDMAPGEKPYYTEVGNGNLNWDAILELADKTGVMHYVVEQDTCPGDPFDSLRQSASFLRQYIK